MSDHAPDWLVNRHGERIAVLESNDRARALMMETMDSKIDKVLENQQHQKGMIGGIVLVIGGIATVLALFKDWLLHHFTQ
jgi:hypothetical protein